MSLTIPERLRPLLQTEPGQQWMKHLPALLTEISENWALEIGEPFGSSSVSFTVPAKRGTEELVLKIQWPHDECAHEADALRLWNGRGAVRLLEHDADGNALLLERCTPGTSLGDSALADPLLPMLSLLPSLWVEASDPFETLEAHAYQWLITLQAEGAHDRGPFDEHITDLAATYINELAGTQAAQFLVHQDLHADNVLAAARAPWLVIDPKPLIGEREFALAPVIRSFELGHSRELVMQRLERLCAEFDLDRERARKWTIAQTVAWNLNGDGFEQHIDVVRWLLES